MNLLELAERCEQAKASSPELDAQICAAARVVASKDWQWAYNYPDWEGRADGRVYLEKGGPSFSAPSYTSSIDAAMTLVPDGVGDSISEEIKVELWGSHGVYPPHVRASAWVMGARRTYAATMPLALCAAALRRRASDGNPKGGNKVPGEA